MTRNRIRTAALGALVLVPALVAVDAGPAHATHPGRNGLIAWSRPFLTTDAEIYVIRPGGGRTHQLTHNDQNDSFPAWSPDGRSIAFESSSATDMDVWVMNVDGTGLRNLTSDAGNADREPAWSPDGNAIVFSRQSPFTGDGGLWVIGADGSNPRRLTQTNSVNHHPTWSPDGRWIVFSSDRDGNLELYRIRPDGTGESRLTFTPTLHEDNPNLSPDGLRIAFDACQSASFPCPGTTPNYEIFSANSDGSGLLRLTNVPGIDWNPAWSPDGTQIAFRSDRTGFTQIWKMDADGSNPTQLTFERFEGGVDPDWQPLP